MEFYIKYIWCRQDFLDDNTNEVILKTERNDNINDHINKLMNGNKIIDTSVNLKKTEILPKPGYFFSPI